MPRSWTPSPREPAVRELAAVGPAVSSVPVPAPLTGRGWDVFLFAAIALVPVVVPAGPSQTAFVDALDVAALCAFAFVLMLRRPELRLPFTLPALLVGCGSLLALTNANAPRTALLALAQDLYLYVWFVLALNLWAVRGESGRFRIAWVLVADAVAVTGFVMAARSGVWSPAHLLAPRGLRGSATFYNPNMFADYLVLSVFVLLSLERRLPRAVFAGSGLLLALGLLLTKSNGGLCALFAGLAVWAIARARALGVPALRVAGMVALTLGVLLAAAWTQREWHWGERTIARLGASTFAGRASHSSERREQIWAQLAETVEREPMGIGPANSAEQAVAIGERERPGSFRSKEAHSDYVAAWVERGFLGFAGLAVAFAEAWRRLAGSWRAAGPDRAGQRLVLAALLAGLVASSVHSIVIEKLHFRHFWLYLALALASSAERRA